MELFSDGDRRQDWRREHGRAILSCGSARWRSGRRLLPRLSGGGPALAEEPRGSTSITGRITLRRIRSRNSRRRAGSRSPMTSMTGTRSSKQNCSPGDRATISSCPRRARSGAPDRSQGLRVLEKEKLANWKNLDPQILELVAAADPGNDMRALSVERYRDRLQSGAAARRFGRCGAG